MRKTDKLHQSIEADIDRYTETVLPPLQHQWPLLGKELFVLEQTLTDTSGKNERPLTEQEKRERRERIRNAIVAQLYCNDGAYSRDTRHLAFLLLRQGRGGAIVGDPHVIEKGGRKQELPYTGLEGYYAGSEKTSSRPGMTPEEIIQEEATIGAQLLETIKKRAIENNSWAMFARLKHVLEGGKPDVEALRDIQVFWSMIVRRLHVRLYHNPEFALTLTEHMEQLEHLSNGIPGRTMEEKQLKNDLQAEYDRLSHERESMSETEKERERQERRTRERIRTERVEEFTRFREETYQILTTSGQGRYTIGVQDASLEEATIIETVTLPKIPGRNMYPPTPVHVTPKQLEGYLFLAQLGEIGGDPLTRSVLVSQ